MNNYILVGKNPESSSHYTFYDFYGVNKLGMTPQKIKEKQYIADPRHQPGQIVQTKLGIGFFVSAQKIQFIDNNGNDLNIVNLSDGSYNKVLYSDNQYILAVTFSYTATGYSYIYKINDDYTSEQVKYLTGSSGYAYDVSNVLKCANKYIFVNPNYKQTMYICDLNLNNFTRVKNFLTVSNVYATTCDDNYIYWIEKNDLSNSIYRYNPTTAKTEKITEINTPYTTRYLEYFDGNLYVGMVDGVNYDVYQYNLQTEARKIILSGVNDASISTTRNGLTIDKSYNQVIFNENKKIKVYDLTSGVNSTYDFETYAPVVALNLPVVKVSKGWYSLKKLNEGFTENSPTTYIKTKGYFYSQHIKGEITFDQIAMVTPHKILLYDGPVPLYEPMQDLFESIYIEAPSICDSERIKAIFDNAVGVPVAQPVLSMHTGEGVVTTWDINSKKVDDVITIKSGATMYVYCDLPLYYEYDNIMAEAYYKLTEIPFAFDIQDSEQVKIVKVHFGDMDIPTSLDIAVNTRQTSLNLILMTNHSVNNALEKDNTRMLNIEGSFKKACSIINPTFIIETMKDLTQVNYLYVPLLNKYYFVNDIINVNYSMWEINAHVDVLSTYKEDIKKATGFIARNEKKYNPYLTDGLRDLTGEVDVTIKDLQKYDFEFKGVLGTDMDFVDCSRGNVIWNVINTSIYYSQHIEPEGVGTHLDAISNITAGYTKSNLYLTSFDASRQLINQLFNNDTLRTYVKNVMVFPFDLYPENAYEGETMRNIMIGPDNNYLSVTAKEGVPSDLPYNNIIVHAKKYTSYHRIKYGSFILPLPESFLDYPPYTKYEIYLPYHNYVEIPYHLCFKHDGQYRINKTIYIYYNINYEDGIGMVYLVDNDGIVIYSNNCQLGVKMDITTQNKLETNNQKNGLMLNATLSGLGSAASLGLGVATGNPLLIAGGGMGLASTIGKTITSYNQIYDRAQAGVNTGMQGLQLPQKAYIRITKARAAEGSSLPTENYKHIYGLPLAKTDVLQNYTGYTMVNNLEIKTTATQNEVDEIKTLLNKGVYL